MNVETALETCKTIHGATLDPRITDGLSPARTEELLTERRVLERLIGRLPQLAFTMLPRASGRRDLETKKLTDLLGVKADILGELADLHPEQLSGHKATAAWRAQEDLKAALKQLQVGTGFAGWSHPRVEAALRNRGWSPRDGTGEVWSSNTFAGESVLKARIDDAQIEVERIQKKIDACISEIEKRQAAARRSR